MITICVDTGFLIALYDESDAYHSQATDYFTNYFESTQNHLLVPWPILYETISTRMVRNKRRMEIFNRDWKTLQIQQRLILFDDREFRESAINECFAEIRNLPQHYRSLSLTDRVIRNILSEVNIKIDLFITFNIKDFQDICRKFGRAVV